MTLAFLAEVYGDDVAEKVATISEYRRVTDANDDPFAKFADATALEAAGLSMDTLSSN